VRRSSRTRLLKFRTEGSRVPDQSDRQLAEMTANYYGMISLIDHSVGRILTTLCDLGMERDTLVVYSTDHGELLGNHGLYLKHPIPYEDLLRVTLVARGPGVAAGRVVAEPVSTLDLAPTFYDLAGVPAPLAVQGRSLRKLLGGAPEARDVAYSEWHVHPSLRCRAQVEDGAHAHAQVHLRSRLGRGRALRSRQRSGRDGQPVQRPGLREGAEGALRHDARSPGRGAVRSGRAGGDGLRA
jgi:arylsulfatase A-like enzyme